MDMGLEEFGLKEEDTRMYDYHNDSRFVVRMCNKPEQPAV